MDLVRGILIAIEEAPTGFVLGKLEVGGYTDEQVGYHAFILKEGGLLEGADTTSRESNSPSAMPSRLTWQGHEFLDAAREQGRWDEAKKAIEKIGGASIQIWVALLTAYARKKLGLPGE